VSRARLSSPLIEHWAPPCRALCRVCCWALIGAVACCWASLARAQDPGPPRALLKLGVEHDSNSRRQTGPAIAPDQLLRVFLKVAAPWSLGDAGTLQAKLLLGAKSYTQTSDEDTLVTTLSLGWSLPLLRTPDHRLALSVSADGSDRAESTSRRDYTRYSTSAGLSYRAFDVLHLYAAAGYRSFLFKPDLTSNHSGASASLSALVALSPEWSISSQYSVIQRRFSSERLVLTTDEVIVSDLGTPRRDWLHAWDMGLTWQGAALVRLRYGLQINKSNSLGPALTRHIAEVFWVQPLPWSLSFQLRASLLRTQFDGFSLADRTLQLDDENRNLLLTSLRYHLPWSSVALEARYALYTQAIGDNASFIRHLTLFGVVITLDDDDTETSPLE
jgi:hypothetical protein